LATSSLSASTVVLHHAFYNEDCLKAACEAYRKFAGVSVERKDEYSTVAITPASGAAPDPVTLQREFLNYVLDLSIKEFLAQ
jgi:hypothetical protein